ncbi:MAG: DUF2628 domain-containing protein [Hyphomicrobium sp.]
MQTYTVHEQPNPPSDRIDRADALDFVKDGFSWVTALLPPFGFAGERMWAALAIYLLGIASLSMAFTAIGVPAAWTSLIVTAINFYLGLEMSTIKRWTLDRRGWTTLGAVTGRDLAECERRFLETWMPSQPAVVAPRATSVAVPPRERLGALWPFAAKG